MATYTVATQDDWEKIVADVGIDFGDVIKVTGKIDALTWQERDLDVHILPGASVTARSDVSNWYRLAGGDLTVVWRPPSGITITADLEGHGGRPVTLIGWPDDTVPFVPLSSRDRVRLISDSKTGPSHYTWIGDAVAQSGAPVFSANLQSWDLLDALFPDNPHLWNAGKYLTRFGRKGDASKRVEDLRKAVTYLERAIKAEERRAG